MSFTGRELITAPQFDLTLIIKKMLWKLQVQE